MINLYIDLGSCVKKLVLLCLLRNHRRFLGSACIFVEISPSKRFFVARVCSREYVSVIFFKPRQWLLCSNFNHMLHLFIDYCYHQQKFSDDFFLLIFFLNGSNLLTGANALNKRQMFSLYCFHPFTNQKRFY